MGACDFWTSAKGATAKEAFSAAVSRAQHLCGHGGYTGTIAEKSSYVLLTPPDGVDPKTFARDLFDDGDPRIDDKWGPAGCVKIGDGEWLFFGWASE